MEVVLFAALGPNPAPLSELVWGLFRQRGWRVREAHVVVTRPGLGYLDGEVLLPGAALDQLHGVLGKEVLPRNRLHVCLARRADGVPVEDDDDPASAEAYQEAIWSAARRATEAAGERRVVFALAAGRRRTMTAHAATVFQLLARPQDACLDVRVSNRLAEGGSGFFFPEQVQQLVSTEHGTFLAREVAVELVEVALPRLRGLLREEDLRSSASALARGQAAIQAASPPRVVVDLDVPEVRIDGTLLPLSPAELLCLAALVQARLDSAEGWVLSTPESLRPVVERCRENHWMAAVRFRLVQSFLGEQFKGYSEEDRSDDVSRLRSGMTRKVREFVREHCPQHAHLLVPQMARSHVDGALQCRQRLRIERAFLVLASRGKTLAA